MHIKSIIMYLIFPVRLMFPVHFFLSDFESIGQGRIQGGGGGGHGGQLTPPYGPSYVIALNLVLDEANKLYSGAANESLCVKSSVHTVRK